MFNVSRRGPVLAAFVLLLPLSAIADQLVMKNGDVITGTISSIAGGKVSIDPSYGSAFTVDLAEVASLESATEFEVSLADDRELSGQIALDESGQQVVVSDDGRAAVSLGEIAAAAQPRPYFQWGAQADFSATFNDGNTDSQNTLLFASGNVRHGDHRHLGDLTFRREETDGVRTKEQDLLNYAYNWIFSDPWYMGGTFTWERDPIRELDHRYTAGLILGRDIFDDGTKFLTISFGAGYSDEEIGGVSDSGAVGLWNLSYTHKLWSGVNFFHDHHITQQFYGLDNLIFKSNTGVRMDLVENLYGTVSLRYDYETEPAAGASKDDSTLAVGIGYSF